MMGRMRYIKSACTVILCTFLICDGKEKLVLGTDIKSPILIFQTLKFPTRDQNFNIVAKLIISVV